MTQDIFKTDIARRREELLGRLAQQVQETVRVGYAFLARHGRLKLAGEVADMGQYLTGGVRAQPGRVIGKGGFSQVIHVALEGGSLPQEYRDMVRKDTIVPPGMLTQMEEISVAKRDAMDASAAFMIAQGGISYSPPNELLSRIGALAFNTPQQVMGIANQRKASLETTLDEAIKDLADQIAKPIWLSADVQLSQVLLPVVGYEYVYRDSERLGVRAGIEASLSLTSALGGIMLMDGPRDGEQSRVSTYMLQKPFTLTEALSQELARFYGGEESDLALRRISTILTEQVRLNKERYEKGWTDTDVKTDNVLAEYVGTPRDGYWQLWLIDPGCYAPTGPLEMNDEEAKALNRGQNTLSPAYAPARKLRAALCPVIDEAEIARMDPRDEGSLVQLTHGALFGLYTGITANPNILQQFRDILDARERFVADTDLIGRVPEQLRGYVRLIQEGIRADLAGNPMGIGEYYDALTDVALRLHGKM